MTWWRLALLAVAVLAPVACRLLGRRDLASLVVGGVAKGALLIIPLDIGLVVGGSVGAWCVAPLALAASWFGHSPLGMVNFLVLQWFGVRLQAEFDREAWLRGPRGRWWASDVPVEGWIAWSLLRWVWPLTGWWSAYRWIARRGAGR